MINTVPLADQPLRPLSVARAWCGLTLLCAIVYLVTTTIAAWVNVYTATSADVGVALRQATAALWEQAIVVGVFLSLWLALRIGAPIASQKERRIAWALGAVPILIAGASVVTTILFFVR